MFKFLNDLFTIKYNDVINIVMIKNAIDDNDIKNIDKYYKSGISVNITDDSGNTSIIYAIRKKKYKIASHILDLALHLTPKLDVNINNDNINLLNVCLIGCNYEEDKTIYDILKHILYTYDVDLNYKDHLGNTYLFYILDIKSLQIMINIDKNFYDKLYIKNNDNEYSLIYFNFDQIEYITSVFNIDSIIDDLINDKTIDVNFKKFLLGIELNTKTKSASRFM